MNIAAKLGGVASKVAFDDLSLETIVTTKHKILDLLGVSLFGLRKGAHEYLLSVLGNNDDQGATGLAQVAEVVWQLRGEAGERQVKDPKVGLVQNSGGFVEGNAAATTVTILTR